MVQCLLGTDVHSDLVSQCTAAGLAVVDASCPGVVEVYHAFVLLGIHGNQGLAAGFKGAHALGDEGKPGIATGVLVLCQGLARQYRTGLSGAIRQKCQPQEHADANRAGNRIHQTVLEERQREFFPHCLGLGFRPPRRE